LSDDPGLTPIYEKLVDERNKIMAGKVQEYLDATDGSYFVVVGAGHLVGKTGIVQLLREKGYSVEQL